MDDGRVFNNYKTGTAIGAGTAYHYGAHEFTPVFIGFMFLIIKFFCVLLCRSLFVVLSFFRRANNDLQNTTQKTKD